MGSSSGDELSNEQKAGATPNTSPPEVPQRSWLDEENPFVAFRRYADEQISSMLQSMIGLPSIMTPPFPDKWSGFPDERNHSRQRRSGDEADWTTDSDRDDNARQGRRWEGRRRSDWDDFDRWDLHSRRPLDSFGFDSFFDDHFPLGFGRLRSFHPFLFDTFFSGEESQAWPIPYLLFSPYSPLHLERSRGRDHHQRGIFSSLFSALKSTTEPGRSEPRWREAFEDLVRIENGQPMLERSSDSNSRKETGNEWLRGLVQRGSLGNNWKLIAGPNDNSPCNIVLERTGQQKSATPESSSSADVSDRKRREPEDTEPATELDLYDRFLQDVVDAHEREYPRAFSGSPLIRLLYDERKRHLDEWKERRQQWERESENWLEQASSGGNKSDRRNNSEMVSSALSDHPDSGDAKTAASSEPSIISTMTRTERRTLPDGSVQTKIVKTKRFADGREESNESVEVVNPPARGASNGSDNNDNQNGKSNGGWFWSG
jgi:hypothetical protein